MTARDTVQETIFGLQAGANDYLKKPFNFDELVERIRVQLRPKNAESEILSLGKITLDTSNHQAYNEEEEILLTQKEFALLEYLMRIKGRVCKRSSIMRNVWDIQFEYNTGVLDVYINTHNLDNALSYQAEKHTKEIFIQGDSILFVNKAEWQEREHKELDIHPVNGSFLVPTELAVSIISTSHILLDLNLFEKNISALKKGNHKRNGRQW